MRIDAGGGDVAAASASGANSSGVAAAASAFASAFFALYCYTLSLLGYLQMAEVGSVASVSYCAAMKFTALDRMGHRIRHLYFLDMFKVKTNTNIDASILACYDMMSPASLSPLPSTFRRDKFKIRVVCF